MNLVNLLKATCNHRYLSMCDIIYGTIKFCFKLRMTSRFPLWPATTARFNYMYDHADF